MSENSQTKHGNVLCCEAKFWIDISKLTEVFKLCVGLKIILGY